MNADWQLTRLSWVADTIVPQRDKPEALDGPIPWVRIEDFDGKFLDRSKSGQGVTASQVSSMPLRLFPTGTVACSCSCTMGATAITTRPLVTNQTFIGLVPGPNLDASYLYYLLQALQPDLQRAASGAIQQYLSQDNFRALRFMLPPMEEQRRIADFLDDQVARIDSLLERARHQIGLLQEVPRSEFAARLESAGADLVQSRQPRLGWVATVMRGASPRPIDDPKYFDDDGTHGWVRIADVTAAGKYLRSTSQTLSELGRSLSVDVTPGELILSISASVGVPCIVEVPCCIHDGFVVLRSPSVDVDYLYFVLRYGDLFAGVGNLGTQVNLNSDIVRSARVPVLDPTRRRRVVDAMTEIEEGTRHALDLTQERVRLLEECRSSLISAAVAGDLDVSAEARRGVPA